ncbi:MAG: putative capsular polysaccharide synthesis family protein [archaeon]
MINKIKKIMREKTWLNKKALLKPINILRHPLKYWKLKNNIYLIYTMGKVGSQTIFETIDQQIKVAKIFHVHYLSSKHFEKNYTKKENIPRKIKKIWKLCKNPKNKIKIITLTRDPVHKKVSGFFQNPDLYGFSEEQLPQLDSQTIIESLNKKRDTFYDAINWFDKEFFEFTGIDIYSQEFDFENKKELISRNNIDVLILRLEDLKSDKEIIMNNLKEFTGEPIFELINRNRTKNKSCKNIYKETLDLITFPDEFVDKMYDSKYCKHFYRQTEIKNFKLKWMNIK